MKNGTINIVDLDFEYKMWKTRLRLFIEEIELIRNRNEEVKSEPYINELNAVELLVLDEHTDELSKLRNRIVVLEDELQLYQHDFPIDTAHQCFKEHQKLRTKLERTSVIHLERVADLINALGV